MLLFLVWNKEGWTLLFFNWINAGWFDLIFALPRRVIHILDACTKKKPFASLVVRSKEKRKKSRKKNTNNPRERKRWLSKLRKIMRSRTDHMLRTFKKETEEGGKNNNTFKRRKKQERGKLWSWLLSVDRFFLHIFHTFLRFVSDFAATWYCCCW